MEYLYGIWMAQESWGYRFSEEDLSSYTPRDEFIDFFLGLDLEGETIGRASSINNMRPGDPKLLPT